MAKCYGTGRVTDGLLTIDTSAPFAFQLREFRDGPVDITVGRFTRHRSTKQNAWYWGVVLATLADYTGHTRDELHEICKVKFLPHAAAICDGNGEVVDDVVIGGSTAQLDADQFGAYVEAIRAWALDRLNCIIPDPAEAP